MRENGVIRSRAGLIAIGWDGRCHVLGIELTYREGRSNWVGLPQLNHANKG